MNKHSEATNEKQSTQRKIMQIIKIQWVDLYYYKNTVVIFYKRPTIHSYVPKWTGPGKKCDIPGCRIV